MTPGIYTLTRDVVNPLGDKRVKREFDRMPLWKKGMRLIVEDGTVGLRTTGLRIYPVGGYSHLGVNTDLDFQKESAEALTAPGVLEIEPPSIEAAYALRHDLNLYSPVMDVLYKSGQLTIEAAVIALEEYIKE